MHLHIPLGVPCFGVIIGQAIEVVVAIAALSVQTRQSRRHPRNPARSAGWGCYGAARVLNHLYRLAACGPGLAAGLGFFQGDFIQALAEGFARYDPAAPELQAGQVAGDDALDGGFSLAAQNVGYFVD
jgi:hypothetical protein